MRETAGLAMQWGIALTDMPAFHVHTITSGTEAEGVAHLQARGALVQARAPMLRMSSLHDLERGRRLEVEETLGYVVANAANAGSPCPQWRPATDSFAASIGICRAWVDNPASAMERGAI